MGAVRSWGLGETRRSAFPAIGPCDTDAVGATIFDGTVERLVWGRNAYTVVRLPAALVDAAAALGTHRVAGTIEGVEVNLAITRAPVIGDPFVYTGAAFLRRIATEVGEPVRCVLAPVDPERVDVPVDLEQSLRQAGVWSVWQSRRPGERRRDVAAVEAAVRPATRARRVADLAQRLVRGDGPQGPEPTAST